MDIFELMVVFVGFAFFFLLTILGKADIKINLMKRMGRLKGHIIAKELRKDGRVYSRPIKLKNNQVTIDNRLYDYDINKTVINGYELREGYFSELTGRQFDPYRVERGGGLTNDQLSDMLIMATSLAMMPKQPMPMKNIGFVLLVAGGILVVAILGGFLTF